MGWYIELDDWLRDNSLRQKKIRHTENWWDHFGKYLPNEIIIKSDLKTATNDRQGKNNRTNSPGS